MFREATYTRLLIWQKAEAEAEPPSQALDPGAHCHAVLPSPNFLPRFPQSTFQAHTWIAPWRNKVDRSLAWQPKHVSVTELQLIPLPNDKRVCFVSASIGRFYGIWHTFCFELHYELNRLVDYSKGLSLFYKLVPQKNIKDQSILFVRSWLKQKPKQNKTKANKSSAYLESLHFRASTFEKKARGKRHILKRILELFSKVYA